MKKLSLQWRITLMTALLIGVACVSMNLLLCSSGVYYMDSIADSLQDCGPIVLEDGETAGFDPQLIPPGEDLTIVVSGAQARFRATSWYITAAIALLGGMVKVDVQQRDRQAVIHVADTGRGIPQEFWQSIFQPFFRVDKSLSRELGGAGLGLPLVWEIARLHGGRVWVEESNDNGSALAVTLLLSASITDTVRR